MGHRWMKLALINLVNFGTRHFLWAVFTWNIFRVQSHEHLGWAILWGMGNQQLLIIVSCYHIIIDLKISEGGGGVLMILIINVSILSFSLWGWGHVLIFDDTSVISSWISCWLIWICYRYCDSAYADGVTYRDSMITDWFFVMERSRHRCKRYPTPRSHSVGHANRVLQRNHGGLTWWKSISNQSASRWTAIMKIQMCPAMNILLLGARVLSNHSMAWMVWWGGQGVSAFWGPGYSEPSISEDS